MIEKVKLNEVAKDLNINGKELTTLLQQRFGGEAKKPQTVLSGDELNFVMEHFTRQHAVADFGEYFKLGEKKAKPAEKPAEKPAAPAAKPAAPRQPARPAQGNRPQQGDRRPENNRPAQGSRPQQGDRRPENNRPAQGNRPQQGNGLRPNLNQKPAAPAAKPAAPQQPAAPRKPIEIRQQAPKQKGPKGENTFTANTVTRTTVDMRTSEVNLDKYNERYEQIAPAGNMKDNFAKKQKLNQRSARRGKPVLSRKEREEEKMRRLELERQRRQRLEVALPEEMTVGELALMLKVQASEIVKKLMGLGVMASISDVIDFDTASLVAMEIGAKVTKQVVVTIEDRLFEVEDKEEAQETRPPIVVVMGHVDHGKTSILDAIRKTSVVSGEAGGITQHIGAYHVKTKNGDVVFLDTPGHEAFTAMRARGAQITDLVILVVAADDGVMEQTREAINHARAANVPIIVAINKIDKPGANPDRVRQELTEYGVIPEEWGGQNMFVNISAKQKIGIDDLLETVLLQADVLELKANPDTFASGNVLEAKLDKGRGSVATVLVTRGTLHVGDTLVAGLTYGRVRAMLDPKGRAVTEAGPSDAVEILGLQSVPNAGDEFRVFEDEREARALADERSLKARIEEQSRVKHVTLENLFETIADAEVKELNLIIKADVQGSIEALQDSLDKMDQSEVRINTIHSAVGAINETDVVLADASNAIIIGFGVRPDGKARSAAEREGVEIRCYDVIYKCLEELDAARIGMLKPTEVEVATGTATVLDTFKVPKVGIAAGVRVEEGEIAATDSVRLVRDGIVVFNGKIASMRHYKDEAKSLKSGSEGGIGLENFQDIKPGDQIEGYRIDQVARTE